MSKRITDDKPYYSIIIAGRNDNYGLHFLFRIKTFFSVLLDQILKTKLSCEIILVEWNPPVDNLKLSKLLQEWFPKTPVRIRILEVPHYVHTQFKHSDKIYLFEGIAKNVGIRRAKGEFLLLSNPDVIFPDTLIARLAKHDLAEDYIYRNDRLDFNLHEIPKKLTTEKLFELARKGTHTLHTLGCRIYLRTKLPFALKMKLGYINAIFMRRMLKKQGKLLSPVHVNVPGDFTLMRRKHWFKLRGYPERSVFSYFDGVPCFCAVAIGLKQHIFGPSFSVFHLDHNRRSARHPHRGSETQYHDDYHKVLNHKKSPIFNSSTWGLPKEKFKETFIS